MELLSIDSRQQHCYSVVLFSHFLLCNQKLSRLGLISFGIDIGTSTSCCFQYQTASNPMHPTISSYLIPSMIAVGEHIRVGSAASRLAESKNYCMIYDIKRIIGKTVDMISDKEKERWPFEVRSVENTTVITIPNNIKSEYHDFRPEDLYYMLVKSMLPGDFSRSKSRKVAVVTVPEKFNDVQRAATKRAMELLNFDSIQLFSEPCAAALYYYHQQSIRHPEQTFAVFDFGGSTLDIAVIRYAKKMFDVLATDGDPYLGGIDIDNALIELLQKKIKERFPSYNPGKQRLGTLKKKAENIKMSFSGKDTKIPASYIDPSLQSDEEITVTRDDFYSIVTPILERAVSVASRVICDTPKYHLSDISLLLLVGGSSQIESLKPLLEKRFPKLKIERLDQLCVGKGACLRGKHDFCFTSSIRRVFGYWHVAIIQFSP